MQQDQKSSIKVSKSCMSSSKPTALNCVIFPLALYGAVTATVLLVLWINDTHCGHQLLQIEKERFDQTSSLNVLPPVNEPFKNLRVKRSDGKRQLSRKRGNRRKQRGGGSSMASAIHLQIDNTYSQPNSPDLKTGKKDDVINYWKLALDQSFNFEQTFGTYSGGIVTIHEKGLYLIYTQITYYDRTGRWSHLVDISGKPFVKCIGAEWGIGVDPESGLQHNTVHQCYSSAVTTLKKGDEVSIKSMYAQRVIHVDKDMTFWGIIKLSK